ncbi:transcription factor [Vermiconidia calcicola]|uniref:Transcription factor n=1 Tax=Vermiconidia calcicola TaxID=1690605 RepID=A0ACC3NHB5_9PEZI|nr:transcription factor [Vermiconidia calcicola]
MEHSQESMPLPDFRVKAPHKKSRLGCITCKKRRIKCDEKRPTCGRCNASELQCTYKDQPSGAALTSPPGTSEAAALSRTTTESPTADGAIPESPFPCTPEGLPLVTDTELARHFLGHTVSTLIAYNAIWAGEQSGNCASKGTLNIWRDFVPALAYSSVPVRHGMLAASAWCLHFHSGNRDAPSAVDYRAVAEWHGYRALQGCRVQLENIASSNVDSIVVCTRLLSFLSLACFRIHRNDGFTLADAEAWTWLHMSRGVQTVQTTVLLSGHPLHPIVREDMKPTMVLRGRTKGAPPSGAGTCCQHALLHIVHATRIGSLPALRRLIADLEHVVAPEDTIDFLSAIDILQQIFDHVCSSNIHNLQRAILAWPVWVPQRVVDLVTSRNHLALLIYAHWLTLVVLLEDSWWVDDMGRSGIADIARRCANAEVWVKSLLEQPLKML